MANLLELRPVLELLFFDYGQHYNRFKESNFVFNRARLFSFFFFISFWCFACCGMLSLIVIVLDSNLVFISFSSFPFLLENFYLNYGIHWF